VLVLEAHIVILAHIPEGFTFIRRSGERCGSMLTLGINIGQMHEFRRAGARGVVCRAEED